MRKAGLLKRLFTAGGYAKGGCVGPTSDLGPPVMLSPGVAVVPDGADKDLIRRLNGDPTTTVITASEALAAMDED